MLGNWAFCALFVVLFALALLLPAFAERRWRRSVYRSGNVALVVEVAARDEMFLSDGNEGIARALALVSLGITGRGRLALEAAREDQRWSSREQRAVAEIMLEVLDGDLIRAERRLVALEAMPLPEGGLELERSRAWRAGVRAMVRVHSGSASIHDLAALSAAAVTVPLLYWPMRYSAAFYCAVRGDDESAHQLVAGAPKWSEDSVFYDYNIDDAPDFAVDDEAPLTPGWVATPEEAAARGELPPAAE